MLQSPPSIWSGLLLEFDFENSVGYWICTTSHALRRAFEQELAHVGDLTYRQWEVLACLACQEGMSQSEMADRLGIEPPTLAGVVTRMENNGWLERKTCSEDRRKNRIYSTDKAEAVWKRTTEICHELREQAIAGIDEETLQLFKCACERIRQNLEAAGLEGATVPCLDNPTSAGEFGHEVVAVNSGAAIN